MRSPEDLSHVIRRLKGGGRVIVVDRGAIIDPEAQAMICARFSRWNKDTLELISSMFSRDVGKFMRGNYKAGYGHKSIAEMGECVILVEDVSMLCAKAIQDFPLYRGQESSTRYIDFSTQMFLNPLGTAEGTSLLEQSRAFHMRGLEVMVPVLCERFPRGENESEKDHRGAIKARAFDIMRGYLPAGATTNVAWVGDLRHVNDHLSVLRNHPVDEVRRVGIAIEKALLKMYPNSFSEKRYRGSENYLRSVGYKHTYLDAKEWSEFEMSRDSLDYPLLRQYERALVRRPQKTELPWSIRECGTMQFKFLLDFGSYRDLQRHRAVIIPMPLLTMDLGFEPWYLDELPEDFRKEALAFIESQTRAWNELRARMSARDAAFMLQYYVPMGMRVPIRLTSDMRGLVYMVELRSTRFVHPTLVKRERQMAFVISERIPYDIAFRMDPEPNRFDVKRGTHDIMKAI